MRARTPVEGLTGGKPVPLPTFEERIKEKLLLLLTQGVTAGLLTLNDTGSHSSADEGGEA